MYSVKSVSNVFKIVNHRLAEWRDETSDAECPLCGHISPVYTGTHCMFTEGASVDVHMNVFLVSDRITV